MLDVAAVVVVLDVVLGVVVLVVAGGCVVVVALVPVVGTGGREVDGALLVLDVAVVELDGAVVAGVAVSSLLRTSASASAARTAAIATGTHRRFTHRGTT